MPEGEQQNMLLCMWGRVHSLCYKQGLHYMNAETAYTK